MSNPHTFTYTLNRDGVPYRAEEYVCQHGYPSTACGVGDRNICPETGVLMVEWWNSLPKQMREREVDRTRILNSNPLT